MYRDLQLNHGRWRKMSDVLENSAFPLESFNLKKKLSKLIAVVEESSIAI